MDLEKDYYYELGVDEDAGTEEIEEAYGRLWKTYGSLRTRAMAVDRRAAAIREAYGVLSDPQKRYEYDKDRILAPVAGPDVAVLLPLTMKELYSGYFNKKRPKYKILMEERRGFITVRLPKRTREDSVLFYDGAGHPGLRGGKDGDLCVCVELQKEDGFEIVGDDIHAFWDLSPEVAGSGTAEYRRFSPAGGWTNYELWTCIPAGTKDGDIIWASDNGEGMPQAHGRYYGNLIVVARIIKPEPKDIYVDGEPDIVVI